MGLNGEVESGGERDLTTLIRDRFPRKYAVRLYGETRFRLGRAPAEEGYNLHKSIVSMGHLIGNNIVFLTCRSTAEAVAER